MKHQILLAGAALLLLLAHAGCRGPGDAPEAERPPCRLPTAVGDTTWQDGVGLALTLADSTGLVPKNCFAEGEDIGFVFTVLNRRGEHLSLGDVPPGRPINNMLATNYFRVYLRSVETEQLVGVASSGFWGTRDMKMLEAGPGRVSRQAAYWLPFEIPDPTNPPARLLSRRKFFGPARPKNSPLLPGDYVAEIEDQKIFAEVSYTLGTVNYLPTFTFRLRVPFRVQAR
jgi:hypothetical protein